VVRPGGLTVVLDVGKSLSKLSLWTADGRLLERRSRPNVRVKGPPFDSLDVEGIEAWFTAGLREFARLGSVAAIVPVAHGAAAAIVRDGQLHGRPMDYEASTPPERRASYESSRDPFAATGSPLLPAGLNLGAQLDALEALDPGVLADGATLLTWPQYWAWRLTGVAAAEVTSLGCHTDLWCPSRAAPSMLAVRRGWAARLPPLRPAAAVLGTLTPEWAARTGLGTDVRVHCGIHDSNAALLGIRGYAELAGRDLTVLSTGTWFVAMRAAATPVDLAALPESRDCLVNIDAAGRPIPSARFMGGREIERLAGADAPGLDAETDQPALLAALPAVLARGARIVPTFAPGTGPFPRGVGRETAIGTDATERRATIALYAALVADVALELIGARECLVVEGRFARAQLLVRALASLRPAMTVYVAPADSDVSYGALRLVDPSLAPMTALRPVAPLAIDLRDYRRAWREEAGA